MKANKLYINKVRSKNKANEKPQPVALTIPTDSWKVGNRIRFNFKLK